MSQKKVGIYIIVSPSNSVYIGQTTDLKKRYKTYNRLDCKSQTKLYNSFLKYGFKKHDFKILRECLVDELNKYERFYQLFFKNAGFKLLNLKITNLDNSNGKLSEETKQKIRLSKLGKPQTIEGNIKRRDTNLNRGKIILVYDRGMNFIKECKIYELEKEGYWNQNVYNVIAGRLKQYKNRIFKYKEAA
jgi:group I intron endonuclease